MAAGCTAPTVSHPNIVLIYADDLGWRDLGVQGSEFYETPSLDRLAAEGMRFTRAYANAPNCAPSRAALLSGQYAPRTGVYTVGSAARGRPELRTVTPVENETRLPLQIVTIAESLTAAGYSTAHVGKWHLGDEGFSPREQGFATAIAGDARGSPPGYFYPYGEEAQSLPGLQEGQGGEYLTDRLVDESIRFIEASAGGPFFLFLSHYAVHTPLQGKPELVDRYTERPPSRGQGNPEYAAMIHSLDEGVGRILASLERLDLTEHTLILFTSDNGGFGPATSMRPLRGSKGMLYEGGIRVPLIARWPGRIPQGSVSDTPVIGTDLYPTLSELSGAPPPTGQALDGVSLVRVFEGTADLAPRDLFWHFPAYLEADRSVQGPWRTTPASAVMRGSTKLLRYFEDDRWELYDLETDTAESRNLVEEQPGVARELRATLEAWWSDTGAYLPQVSPAPSPTEAR